MNTQKRTNPEKNFSRRDVHQKRLRQQQLHQQQQQQQNRGGRRLDAPLPAAAVGSNRRFHDNVHRPNSPPAHRARSLRHGPASHLLDDVSRQLAESNRGNSNSSSCHLHGENQLDSNTSHMYGPLAKRGKYCRRNNNSDVDDAYDVRHKRLERDAWQDSTSAGQKLGNASTQPLLDDDKHDLNSHRQDDRRKRCRNESPLESTSEQESYRRSRRSHLQAIQDGVRDGRSGHPGPQKRSTSRSSNTSASMNLEASHRLCRHRQRSFKSLSPQHRCVRGRRHRSRTRSYSSRRQPMDRPSRKLPLSEVATSRHGQHQRREGRRRAYSADRSLQSVRRSKEDSGRENSDDRRPFYDHRTHNECDWQDDDADKRAERDCDDLPRHEHLYRRRRDKRSGIDPNRQRKRRRKRSRSGNSWRRSSSASSSSSLASCGGSSAVSDSSIRHRVRGRRRQQQHRSEERARGQNHAGLLSRPTGVVSDDDDAYGGDNTHGGTGGGSDSHVSKGPRLSTQQDSHANRAALLTAPVTEPARSVGRCPHDTMKRNKNNNATTNTDSSRSHDDSAGHFHGGPGTVIARRYEIVREVGRGTFGRVVESLDLRYRNANNSRSYAHSRRGQARSGFDAKTDERCPSSSPPTPRREGREAYVAIKIVRNVKRYYDSALIEANVVNSVNRRGGRGLSHCVIMHDAFSFKGHYCMVFENLGPSLYDFMKRHLYQPFPMICVESFAIQLLETLEFLHSFGLIHTDLKCENVLLMNDREVNYGGSSNSRHHHSRHQYRPFLGCIIPESTRIKVIDFGGATFDDDRKSSVINTRQYRAPEVILGIGWSMPSDMWSVGCILAELYQGELLFSTHDNIEHLALMEHMIGVFPRRMIRAARKNATMSSADTGAAYAVVIEAFDTSSGLHRMDRVLSPDHVSFVRQSARLEDIIIQRRSADSKNNNNNNAAWFLKLLRMMLVLDPMERATARECLQYMSRIRRHRR